MTQPFRWSFSQWETYHQCPAKWNYRSVQKLPDMPTGPAAARGSLIHDTVEKYIKGADVGVLHEAIKPKYVSVFDEFRACQSVKCEDETKREVESIVPGTVAVTIFDVSRGADCRMWIGEWKSGKPKPTHPDQRSLYALSALTLPGVGRVEVTTYYLEDTGKPETTMLDADTAEPVRMVWQQRIEQMQGDAFCAPKPGMHCNWCGYAKKRGGPCQFGS